MNYASTFTGLAIASVMLIACNDTDGVEVATVYDEADVIAEDTYTPPAVDATAYSEQVSEVQTPAADRASDLNDAYSGLMPDEIRYRNSDGDVDFSALPAEEIDGLGSDWAPMHRD